MKIVVTGAAGYLGARVAALLAAGGPPLHVTDLILVDVITPARPPSSTCRVTTIARDLADAAVAEELIDGSCDVLFHLAAIVSGHAEVDFDLGYRVNFDATRNLLEAARRKNPALRLVFTSTCAVFGGDLPPVVNDTTATTPETSYGAAKAMSELLINDYSRKGFVNGRVVRLPTVTVRAGPANQAVTSFASGIVREPLAGLPASCPVPPDLHIWVTSPRTVVRNIVHAATLPAAALDPWRVLTLPGFVVSVAGMVAALRDVAGEQTAALVHFKPDAKLARILASLPAKFDNSRALLLGFDVDTNFADVIRAYMQDELKR